MKPGWKGSAPRFWSNSDLNVVSGFFQADPVTKFEVALGAATLPLRHEIDPATFLPSSRSIAFRKSAADAVGGYPEWLDYCEDLVFDLRLKASCGEFDFEPEALAYFRPRRSLAAFYQQYFRYARGDGKANLWRRRHLIRYLTYLVLVPAVCLLRSLAGSGLVEPLSDRRRDLSLSTIPTLAPDNASFWQGFPRDLDLLYSHDPRSHLSLVMRQKCSAIHMEGAGDGDIGHPNGGFSVS